MTIDWTITEPEFTVVVHTTVNGFCITAFNSMDEMNGQVSYYPRTFVVESNDDGPYRDAKSVQRLFEIILDELGLVNMSVKVKLFKE